MKKYLIALTILLVFPIANAQLEKPNWSIGDYWKYTGSYSMKEDIEYENYSMSISVVTQSVDLTMEVVDVEVKEVDGKLVGCYKTAVNATISGDLSIKGNLFGEEQQIDGTFNIDASGNIYFTTKNLSVVSNENEVYINLSTTIPIPNFPVGKADIMADYNPPLDFMDFPVNEGEKWSAESYATLYYGDFPTSGEVTFYFECTKRSGEVYIIKSDYNPFGEIIPFNNTYMFWNENKGMVEWLTDTGGNQSLDIKLKEWNYKGEENTPPQAEISYTPSQPKVGTNIIFTGKGKDDGRIVSWLWEFGDGKTSTKQSPSHTYTNAGTYTVKLTVMDNYGETNTTSISLTVEKSGGGGNTPGFEISLIAFAIFAILLRKKFR